MTLQVFASGSGGNSLAVRSAAGAQLLVDVGLIRRELRARASACGVDLARTSGILVTHDHGDHFCGIAGFHKAWPGVPIFANGDTADSIAVKTGVADGWNIFETAVPFEFEGFRITPFSVSHDAADPVGFLVECDGRALFIGTDTGIATIGFREAFRRCDCAVLESNHDSVLLETSNRPAPLKQRISGRSGHLSNDDAAELMRFVNPPRLKTLLLAHLSEQCNTPSLALAAMRAAFADCGRSDIRLDVLEQNTPSAAIEV